MFEKIKDIDDVIKKLEIELKTISTEIEKKQKMYNKLYLYQTYLKNIKDGRS